MASTDPLHLARDLAKQAGALALDHLGKVARLTKRNDEAVTEADRACQRLIVDGLRAAFPGDGVIGEESDSGQTITAEIADARGRVWVIDPIDGTNNFIAGMGAFAVCIGLLERGEPVLGVVYDVTRGDMYWAQRGKGAWRGDRRIRVADDALSARSLVMCSSNLVKKDGRVPQWSVRWLGQSTWKLRMLGSAALEAVQVAAGAAHGSVTINGKLWDAVAPAAIVLEAGGKFTSLDGSPVFPFDLTGYDGAKVPFIAAAPLAHEELRREIQWHP